MLSSVFAFHQESRSESLPACPSRVFCVLIDFAGSGCVTRGIWGVSGAWKTADLGCTACPPGQLYALPLLSAIATTSCFCLHAEHRESTSYGSWVFRPLHRIQFERDCNYLMLLFACRAQRKHQSWTLYVRLDRSYSIHRIEFKRAPIMLCSDKPFQRFELPLAVWMEQPLGFLDNPPTFRFRFGVKLGWHLMLTFKLRDAVYALALDPPPPSTCMHVICLLICEFLCPPQCLPYCSWLDGWG